MPKATARGAASGKKFDVYKTFAAEFVAPPSPVLLRLSAARYLAIAGRGDPKSAVFQAKVGALYNVAFTVKMARKFAGRDYTVSKLEGLWWVAGNRAFTSVPRGEWNWKIMIRTPDFITAAEVQDAIGQLVEKGKPGEVTDVRLETLKEGRVVQLLHVGPYEQEQETIGRMRDFATANGLRFDGVHHEIYLSDPRRVAPARLRTILRQPVR